MSFLYVCPEKSTNSGWWIGIGYSIAFPLHSPTTVLCEEFQHLFFLPVHGMSSRQPKQKARKKGSSKSLSKARQFLLPSQKWHNFNMVMMFHINLFSKQGPVCCQTEMEKGQPFLPLLLTTIPPFRGGTAWKLQLSKSVFHKEWHLQNQIPPLPFLGYEQVLGVLARPLLQCSFCH